MRYKLHFIHSDSEQLCQLLDIENYTTFILLSQNQTSYS